MRASLAGCGTTANHDLFNIFFVEFILNSAIHPL
jgi:hypothetical protein